MATRKDLLKAHTFIQQRLVSALVDRDPDNPQNPLRRAGTGMFVGVMLAILVTAGFGVVGLLRPGNSQAWKTDNAVIVDTSNGEVLVYLGGKLYPTANLASAKLVTGGGAVQSVKSSSLRGFPRERPIGIPQAPTQVPAANELSMWPARVCSVPAPPQSRTGRRSTTAEIGQGAVPAESVSFVAQVDGPSGRQFLVTEGRAYAMDNRAVALQLGFGGQVVHPGNAFLDALPKGPPLEPLSIPGAGERSERPVPGIDPTVGTLIDVEGADGTKTWFILTQRGLAEISPLEAAVITAETGKKSQTIKASEASQAQNPQQRSVGRQQMPARLPERTDLQNPDAGSVCATWPGKGENPKFAFGAPTPEVPQQGNDPTQADVVVQPSLRGALVKPDSSLGPADPGMLVVQGKRFGIADGAAKEALGYKDLPPEPVPVGVLKLIPEGLDPGQVLSVQAAQLQR